MRRVPVVLLLVTLIAGYACSQTLDADDYDRSCATSADCVAVFVGDVCDCACEPVSAISRADHDEYVRDRAETSCRNDCGPCAEQHVGVCTGGRCEAERCPGSVKFCGPACGSPPTTRGCTCPAGMVDTLTCASSPVDGGTDSR